MPLLRPGRINPTQVYNRRALEPAPASWARGITSQRVVIRVRSTLSPPSSVTTSQTRGSRSSSTAGGLFNNAASVVRNGFTLAIKRSSSSSHVTAARRCGCSLPPSLDR
ncbi:unnamed protein product, partial [Ectocarpus sp. 12 AP-2014]